ncbi:MAG TPA: iron ABC transporter permease [Stellaceae bacterium]|nr:iron ABC transporter permease [Stellaceae bacterium]
MAAVAAETQPAGKSRLKGDRPSGWAIAMMATACVASLVVLALLAIVLWLSVIDGQPGDPDLSYTVANYVETFGDPFVWRALFNTFIFSGLTLIVSMGIGTPLAWIIERTDFPGKTLVFSIMTIGLLVPGFATAIGWEFLLHPRIGMINTALMMIFGLKSAPFSITNLWGMGWVQGLGLAPVAFVMSSVVLRAMDPALEDAASISGARPYRALLKITLPLAWPGLLAAGIFIFMIGFAAFDVPAIIGLAGNVYTFATYTFDQMRPPQGDPEYGAVSALSTVMVVIGLLLSWWYARMQRRAPQYAVVTGKGYRPRLVPLTGGGKFLAVSFVALYLLLSQVVPLLVIVWTSTIQFPQPPTPDAIASMSWINYTGLNGATVWRGLKNTVELMVMAPIVTIAVAFSISWIVLRSQIRGRALFDFIAFLPLSVPSIVFSMAALLLALFVLQAVIPIYGTIWILLLVYVVSRISYATRITNSALIQIHRELEEQAQIAGAGLGGVMCRVLAPLLKPALGYAFIWIALLAYRELTVPVLLATNDNLPLAVVIWNMWFGSQFGQASAVVVIMLVAMTPLIYLGFWVSRGRAVVDR